MRLALLTLVLGILIGFAGRSVTVNHFQWSFAFPLFEPTKPKIARSASVRPVKPIVYPSPEKTLARLKQQYDEAVVVVLADESYDDRHKLIRVAVVEVWKGPPELVGKTMDSRLEEPLASMHSDRSERVLRFMPMTPHLDTASSVTFTGEVLRMNPALTVSSLRAALLSGKEKAVSTVTYHTRCIKKTVQGLVAALKY